MNYNLQLLLEATIVGISVIIMGTLITYIFALSSGRSTSFIWNPAMFISLFLIGFLSLFYILSSTSNGLVNDGGINDISG